MATVSTSLSPSPSLSAPRLNSIPNGTPSPTIITKVDNVSAQLHSAISEILPSEDPLDDPNFNTVEYINNVFPTEQSLNNMDRALMGLKVKIHRLDKEILTNVRKQMSVGDKGKEDLEIAKGGIQELFNKINDIKRKAEQSEVMVQEICRDIKSLDYAKRHLTVTIKALKRLQMLVTGIEQLKVMVEKQQYREVGNLIEAVNQLLTYFDDYKNIPKIADLQNSITELKKTLQQQIYDQFTSLLEKKQQQTEKLSTQLADICFVIDALGPNVRQEFITWFCNKQLSEYNKLFRPEDETSKLEQAERRFAWIKRTLRNYDDQFISIFPLSWKMDEKITDEFCKRTREQFVKILDASSATLDHIVFVQTIQKTMDLEKHLNQRWAGSVNALYKFEENVIYSSSEEEEEEDAQDNPHSAEAIKKRYKKFQRQKEKEKRKKEREEKKKSVDAADGAKFKGKISSCFDPYMHVYINYEDRTINDLIDKLVREETWMVEDEEKNKVLRSCTDMIYYFKESITYCSQLTKNRAFFDLYKLLKKYFKKYAEILANKIPNPTENLRLTPKEEKTICLLINTAEFCNSRIAQLIETIKRIIGDGFRESVEMNAEQDDFSGIIAKGTKALVTALDNKAENALLAMRSTNWGDFEATGDQSAYASTLYLYITDSMNIYKSWLNKFHFVYLCDSFAGTFIPHLIGSIQRCKRINEVGAEQLLLDLVAIRGILLELINISNEGEEGPAAPSAGTKRYLRRVNEEMEKGVFLLKCINSPPESLIDTFRMLGGSTLSDFQKIMDLKGLRKGDQGILIEFFNKPQGELGKLRRMLSMNT